MNLFYFSSNKKSNLIIVKLGNFWLN